MLEPDQPQDHTGGDKVGWRQSEREGNGASMETAYGRIQQPLPEVPRKLVASICWFRSNPFFRFPKIVRESLCAEKHARGAPF